MKVPLARFLALDIAGIVLWAGTWMSLGYLFSQTLQSVVTQTARAGSLLGALAAAFIIYALVRIVVRRRFLRRLRAARIPTSELKAMLDRGEDVWIADLRSANEVAASPYTIPGSANGAEAIARSLDDIPRDRDIVLVCT